MTSYEIQKYSRLKKADSQAVPMKHQGNPLTSAKNKKKLQVAGLDMIDANRNEKYRYGPIQPDAMTKQPSVIVQPATTQIMEDQTSTSLDDDIGAVEEIILTDASLTNDIKNPDILCNQPIPIANNLRSLHPSEFTYTVYSGNSRYTMHKSKGLNDNPQFGLTDGLCYATQRYLNIQETAQDFTSSPALEYSYTSKRDPTYDEPQQWMDTDHKMSLKRKHPKHSKSRVKAKSSSRNSTQKVSPSKSPKPGHAPEHISVWDRSNITHEFRTGPSRPPMPSLSITLEISKLNTHFMTENEGVAKPTEAVELPVATSAPGSVPVNPSSEPEVQVENDSAAEINTNIFSTNVDTLLRAATVVDKENVSEILKQTPFLPLLPVPQTPPQPDRYQQFPQQRMLGVKHTSLPVQTRSRTLSPSIPDYLTPRSRSRSRRPLRQKVDSGRSRSPIPQMGSSWETMSEPLDYRTTITSERNDSRYISLMQAASGFRPESSEDACMDDIRDRSRSRSPLRKFGILESKSNFRPFQAFAFKSNVEKNAAMACDITHRAFQEDMRTVPLPMADTLAGNLPQCPGSPWHDSSSGSPRLQIDWSGSPKPNLNMNMPRPASPVPFEKLLETPRPDCQHSGPTPTPVPELLRPVALRPKKNNA